jgi:hypothetical protein
LNPDVERRHLAEPGHPAASTNAGLELSVRSSNNEVLLARCQEVLLVVLQHDEENWPPLTMWQRELPKWFVDACGPERTVEEAREWLSWWRTLPPDEQAAATDAKRWALSDWLWWLEPGQRTWYWLGARLIGSHDLRIFLQTDGSPAPTGALHWLLKAAGASAIEEI